MTPRNLRRMCFYGPYRLRFPENTGKPHSSVKIIHKYVLREHLGPLVFALSALTSLMLLNYIAKQLGNLVGKGLSWTVILEFFLLSIPFTIAMTLPMAVLVSVLYAFSRLASENEITAMKANGISMRRLLLPVLAVSIVFAFGMVMFNDQALPRTNHRLRALQGDIARKKPSFALREQVINEVAPNQFFLRTTHLDPETNKMRDVTIYDLSDQLRRRTIYADSGMMAFAPNGSDLELTLYHGIIQEVPRDEPTRLQRMHYEVDLIRVKGVANAFQRDSNDTYKSDREMSVCELQSEVSRHERDYLRAYDRYNAASAIYAKDSAGQVTLTQSPTGRDTTLRQARGRSLGRAYCNGLRYLEQRGLSRVINLVRGIGHAVSPAVAFAQQSQRQTDTAAAIQDTARAQRDSTRRDSTRQDSTRRDSAQKADTAASVKPYIVSSRDLVDTTAAAAALPIPPSTGVASTIPAITEMETQRSQMLSARAQMNQFEVEIHKKFAISFACIVFVLLGAPLALRFPRGGVGLVIGVSLVVFALYYVGLIAGESLADRNLVRPSLAMWGANIVFGIAGLVLLSRMEREGGAARGKDSGEWWERVRQLGRRIAGRGARA
jgi:lipopolysaccharide export system permease protein